MGRFPEITEADAGAIVRIAQHASQYGIESYLVITTQQMTWLQFAGGGSRLDDMPPSYTGFYENMAAAGFLFVTRSTNSTHIRPTPLAHAFARYRQRRRIVRWLSDTWYWLNADRPLWLKSTYGCLAFLAAAFTTGVGFVVGLWLARMLGIPLT